MAESFTTTHTCDACGQQVTQDGLMNVPAFWLTVSFNRADPDAAAVEGHYCSMACLLRSIDRFAEKHADQDWQQ